MGREGEGREVTEEEREQLIYDLVAVIAEQQIRISALEESLSEEGVLDTDHVREIYAAMLESFPKYPAAPNLASIRDLLESVRLPTKASSRRSSGRPSPTHRTSGLSVVRRGEESE